MIESYIDCVEYLEGELASLDPTLLSLSEGRAELTRYDPLAFALVYLSKHLSDDSTNNEITLSEFHAHLIEWAKGWILPLKKQGEYRDAFVAPRMVGKSTWLFLILPMWAAAHGHSKYVAAYADAASQAQQHLRSFRTELDNNALLRQDFPSLCAPAMRTGVARQLADNRQQIHQANGFIFAARGVDSATLGAKEGAQRPDLIILDDIEPDGSTYSPKQKDQRLETIRNTLFYLNPFARVVISGTTVMNGSIIHDLIRSTTIDPDSDDGKQLAWVSDENISVHYFPAIIDDQNGLRSIWPQRWPLEDLQAQAHSRTFKLNMMNEPVSVDDPYWSQEHFRLRELEAYGRTILSVDPAVTAKGTSDYTGMAVISKAPTAAELYIREACHLKGTATEIRNKILFLLNEFPEISLILLETNQGGDLWLQALGDLGVRIRTIHQNESKEIRASKALLRYERGQVWHTKVLTQLEQEMTSFPNSLHDDLLDAVTSGINFFVSGNSKKAKATQKNYL